MASRAPIDWQEPIVDRLTTPAGRPLEPTGFLQNVAAGFDEMRIAGNTYAADNRLRNGYDELLAEMNRGQPEDRRFANPTFMSVFPWEEEMRIFDEIGRRRDPAQGGDPDYLRGVPGDWSAFRAHLDARDAARLRRIREVQAGATRMGTIGSFVGGIGGSMTDPVNLFLMPIGGAASTIPRAMAREAVENMIIETALQPAVIENYAALGEDLTARDSIRSILFAGGAGAGIRGAVELGGAGVRGLRRRWSAQGVAEDGPIGDAQLADVLRATIPEPQWTPDLRAAVHVIERDAEIREASPFEPGPAGDEAHGASISAALERISREVPQPAPAPPVARGTLAAAPSPRAAAGPVPDFDRQWQAIEAIEGGMDAQGRFRTSPAGAIGPGQVMPGTAPEAARLAGVPFDDRRYRTDAGYNRMLGQAYYREQLRVFGDPSMAAAAYNAGPGSAARGTGVRGAIARAERAGEPGNWEAYLPAETRAYVANFRRRTGMGDSGAAAEVRTAAAAGGDAARLAELEADALARSTIDPDAPPARAGAGEALFEPVPVLRRDLFASDEDWADAQLRIYREHNDADPGEIASSAAAGAAPGREAEAGGATGPGAGEGPVRASEAVAARPARRRPPRGPRSLLEFISDRGGIEDVGGDLAAMDAGRWHRGAPFRRKLVRQRSAEAQPGVAQSLEHAPDAVLRAALDAGYFPQYAGLRGADGNYADLPDLEILRSAIDRELHGKPRYTPEDQADVDALAAVRARHFEHDELIQRLESDAATRGLELDAVTLEDALARRLAGGGEADAVTMAVHAAAFRDAYGLAAETGKISYAMDDAGRRWDDDVNWHDPGAAGAADREAGGGVGRSGGQPGDAAQGRALGAEPEDAAGGGGASLERFADPDGEGARAQTASLEHDLRAALDRGAEADPAIAARQRQETGLRAEAKLRPGDVDQKGEIGLGLFDAADQPTFRLDEEGEARPLAEIFDALDADDAAAVALKGCL